MRINQVRHAVKRAGRSLRVVIGLGLAATGLATAQVIETVHPGFTIQDIRPSALNAQVGGMDFLPDGRMVFCTWPDFGNKGEVYIVENAQSGNKAQVTYKVFATGLYEPLGVKVLNGVIYVQAKDALLRLPDANKDGTADKVETVVKGWGIQKEPAGVKNLEFALGLLHKDGLFYTGLATRWPADSSSTSERGCIVTMDTTKPNAFQVFACGIRTPNGLVFGPENEIFTTENEGNWVPESKLVQVRKDHFYGVKKSKNAHALESKTPTPPALWMPHGEIATSPTQPVYLKTGIFKGQMLAGDNRLGTLQRYFLEKVNGAYQGMVIKFTAGIEAGSNRIMTGPDSAVYIGGIGATTAVWDGWAWNSKYKGLARMTEKANTAFFDILAIRSKGSDTFEVEFTEAANDAANTAGNYTVRQRSYAPEYTYGCCESAWANLTVSAATLSADKKKVTLKVSGLKLKNVLNFQFKTFAAASGNKLWANQAWYTLNDYGPAEEVPVATLPQARATQGAVKASLSQGKVKIHGWLGQGKLRYEIRDIRGLAVAQGEAPAPDFVLKRDLNPGLYRVLVYGDAGQFASASLAVSF